MIEPFFFGPREKSLYGCLDLPRGEPRATGVLLCYPVGREYFAAHRGFRLLASRLSQKGFPVLRFDYFGSGDSFGEPEQTRFPQMREDVAEAFSELRRRSRCSSIAVVGQQLGASLIMAASLPAQEVSSAVLWDPPNGPNLPSGAPELDAAGVPTPSTAPARNVLIVETDSAGSGAALAARYRELGARAESVHSEAPPASDDGVDRITVPAKAIGAIVSWMAQENG
jgi:dienelactone hydrolase